MKIGLFCAAAIAILATATSASALDRKVKVINSTSVPLVEFYASNVGTQSWEEDILGADVLPSGSSVNVNIDDGSGYCKFDFKGVFEDGDEAISEGVDVCSTGTFTFTE